jgi:hypothetical protein
MPWPVYSERFLHHQASGYWYWWVPEGKRAIVSSVAFVNLAQAGSFAFLRIGTIVCAIGSFQAVNQTLTIETGQIAYQGDYLELYISHDGLNCTVSGKLLEDQSGQTGPPAGAQQLPSPPSNPWPGSLPSPPPP